MGAKIPYLAKPNIARTPEEILECSQSVYSVSPVNTILSEINKNDDPLAYVRLPDQVASIRKLQKKGIPLLKTFVTSWDLMLGRKCTSTQFVVFSAQTAWTLKKK